MSSRTPFFAAALFAIPILLPSAGPGCATRKERREIVRTVPEPQERTPDRGRAGEGEREAPEEPYALRVNRTLLYPVQWGRAEDLAETLRPLIEASYGPGTVVVAHPESNHLLIYLPPRSAREPARSPAPPPRQVAPPFPRR